ncbi:LytTR family DNA-binding domain-containing protein [Flagellimonas sp. CMM7]|uniref:LytR/AlgR family response regulator transcription factor n=1 Tax=Flagellimonas sp. CMM7 TaxID=2654676 RepID=UPI0013D0C7CD|nr:LytTR family DNA-binding domain-containing protein [Flagellimonas sp. CMM7]UII79493.1 LytTR family transcriptional regulator [Flagellimonas sp. CMM7]
MRVIQSEKRFYFLSIILLVVIFIITLIQNMIRYSNHSSYSVWVSIVYLCVSVLLFIPFIILTLRLQKEIKKRYAKWFWLLVSAATILSLIVFYLLSNVILHAFGYFDSFIDSEYARYYFGREALYHLLLIAASAVYVYNIKNKTKIIQVYKGRKLMTIGLELIEWIEAEGHYLNFYSEAGTFIKRDRIGVLAEQLHPDFVRIHRKYIVNKSQIIAKEKDKRDEYIVLSSGKKLKIGQSFKPISW